MPSKTAEFLWSSVLAWALNDLAGAAAGADTLTLFVVPGRQDSWS